MKIILEITTILPTNNPLRLRKNLLKMTFSEKMKTIDDKIDQNNAQYNSYRQTAKSLALSRRNVGKYKFLKCGDVLPENGLLDLNVHH